MKDKINSIMDFSEIIDMVNDLIKDVSHPHNGLDKIIKKIGRVSAIVLSLVGEEAYEEYNKLNNSVMEILINTNDFKIIENWIDTLRELIAVEFFKYNAVQNVKYNAIQNVTLEPTADEVDEKFVEFFHGYDKRNIITAYTFAVMRFAHKRPKFCYDELIESFKKYPSMFADLYKDSPYFYFPELVNDTITEVCPICGGTNGRPFYCADQTFHNEGIYGSNMTLEDRKKYIIDNADYKNVFSPVKLWMKCDKCNNLYAYNYPVIKNSEVQGHFTKKTKKMPEIMDIKGELHVYSEIFNRIREYNNGKKYLEVGIGDGQMLAVALEMGYDVSAVEICEEDCANVSHVLGLDIVCSDIIDYQTDKKFNVIIMGDVLEHTLNPIKVLEKAYDMLEDDGILWLSTPNYNSGFTRMRKFTDPMWNQRHHFTYFSYEGLKPFIEKVGFSIKRYDVSNRYNGSMELILQK